MTPAAAILVAADLYALSGTAPVFHIHAMSAIDASTSYISSGSSEFGIHELAAGTDGRLYGLGLFWIEQIDPATGDSSYVAGLEPCVAHGGFTCTDGHVLRVGASLGFQCAPNLIGWHLGAESYASWLLLPDDFYVPHVLTQRDDGRLLAMNDGDPNLYTVTGAFEVVGTFEEGTIVESFALDRTSGVTYMLGQAPGDPWSLYEIDLDTLALTWIGEVDPDITAIAGPPVCRTDIDGDGSLTILDFVAFQIAWQAHQHAGDANGDGAFNGHDFTTFQLMFDRGCP